MKKQIYILISILISVIFIAGCGSGGGGDGDENGNTAPVSNAGVDQSVSTCSTISLDGIGSSDAEGDPLTYSWSLTSIPVGSNATLSDTSAVNPTFMADVDGTYVLSLVVNDGQTNSTTDTCQITASPTSMQLTTDSATDSNPGWSPDGSKIVFVSNRSGNNDIWVMDRCGSNLIQLTTHSANDSQPHWSSDGTRIGFRSDRSSASGSYDIWVMNADGSNKEMITTGGGTPDSNSADSKLVFTSHRTGDGEIYIMDINNGSGVTNLTNNLAEESRPSFSPDDSKIVFESNRAGNMDVWIMNIDGSGLTQLTNTPENEGHAHFNPDNTKITFSSERTGNFEIWIMNSDGTDQTQLTDNPANDGGGYWSPDGKSIVFRSDREGNDDIWIYALPNM